MAIVYNVTAPTTYIESEGIVVRDMNSFWHTSDPENPEELFNDQQYTGSFDSYHKQQGYYASTGGRDNTTTRFRRYPRETDGEPIEHISLSARDGLNEFLIRPDHIHTVQLVSYEDVIQYIVDEKVVYEIREGDTVTITRPDGENEEVVYTTHRFPPYSEGWFGFRMVNTHHIYSNFKVYRLLPADDNESGPEH